MAYPDEHISPALRDLSDALDPQGIDWAVTGAVAANNYRDQIRTTTDLDVILTLADNDIEDVRDALRQRGWSTIRLEVRQFAVVGGRIHRFGQLLAGQRRTMDNPCVLREANLLASTTAL